MQISARNRLRGKIVSIEEGAVNGIVALDIGNGNIVSAMISMAAIRELKLAVGKEACAIIKASSVILAVECDK